MLDKGDVETCKQEAKNYIEFMESAGDNAAFAKVLLAYIEQLEKENKRYKHMYNAEHEIHRVRNRQLEVSERNVSILKKEIEKLKQEKIDTYYKGYIDKQNEAMQICKSCKYIKDSRKKDSIIDAMADCIAYGGKIYEGEPLKIKQYFEKKVEESSSIE